MGFLTFLFLMGNNSMGQRFSRIIKKIHFAEFLTEILNTRLRSGSEWPKKPGVTSRYARNLYNPKIKIIFRADFEIILFIHYYLLKKSLGRNQRHFMDEFYSLSLQKKSLAPKKFDFHA